LKESQEDILGETGNGGRESKELVKELIDFPAKLARIEAVAQGKQAVSLGTVECIGSAQAVKGSFGRSKPPFDAYEMTSVIGDNRLFGETQDRLE